MSSSGSLTTPDRRARWPGALPTPTRVRTGGSTRLARFRSLEDFRGKRVGIVAGTVAISEKDHDVVKVKSREELLDGFARSRLDAALIDADFAAWYLQGHPQLGLRLLADYVARERWNMALAVRATDTQLLVDINRALGQLAASGDIRRIYQKSGVPFRPPFSGAASRELPRDSWRRIRERGELTVCADPANLPYSSAKNDLPGFDVELARALAERLKVKLRIEWLDVGHETAVGKLIERECDLVFGEPVATNLVADDEELDGKAPLLETLLSNGLHPRQTHEWACTFTRFLS